MAARDSDDFRKTRQHEVERIVRNVLAEVLTKSGDAGGSSNSGQELVVTGKVISAAELKGRLDGIARLVAPRGAILTPSARDELRERNIALASAVGSPANKPDATRMWVGIAAAGYGAESLVRSLEASRIAVERVNATGLVKTVDEVCKRVVGTKQVGVLIVPDAAAAACLANRRHGIRAIVGDSVAAVKEAARSIAANVIVIDPTQKNMFETRQMIRAALGGQWNCPADVKAALE